MKLKIFKASAIFILLAAELFSARAQTYFTNSFSFSPGAVIPDGNPSGFADHQTLGGIFGSIYSLSVELDIASAPGDTAFNGDLYSYLRLGGISSILLNRPGLGVANPDGYDDAGFNVTFTTAATDNIHFYQNLTYSLNGSGQLTGTWQPDGRAIDPQSPPVDFDLASSTALLDLFDGSDPNGTWTLFLADLSNTSQAELVGWNLQIVTVPEPPTWALFVPGVFWFFWKLRRKQSAV